jgi:integrase/recombinase XerD
MNEIYLEQLNTEAAIRNLTETTARTYHYYVTSFLKHTEKKIEYLTCADVREFLLKRKGEGISASTLNLYNSSIRFFFRHVLHKLWDDEVVPRMKLDYHLPETLTMEEIEELLASAKNIKHKAMLATMYSSGLRVSEVIHLHYDDIFRSTMKIHVRKSKSRSDRYTILSKRNLELLTEYWYTSGKPRGILFPSGSTNGYIDSNSVNQFLKRYAKKAGIKRNFSSHALRHSFACHLLEAGVDRHYIQELLGHRDPKSTEVYLHVSNKVLMGVKSPFDFTGETND